MNKYTLKPLKFGYQLAVNGEAVHSYFFKYMTDEALDKLYEVVDKFQHLLKRA